MNRENFDRWLNELRTTTLGQMTKALFDYDYANADTDEPKKACCLGIGVCLLRLEEEYRDMTLPPMDQWFSWLGLDADQVIINHRGEEGALSDHDGDLVLDWPNDFWPREWSAPTVNAAGLNDTAQLTFEQIADCLDYFGLIGASDG